MSNWQPGDMAICIYPHSWKGREVEIISVSDPRITEGFDCSVYTPEKPSKHPEGTWSQKFAWLKQLPGQNELCEWEDMKDIWTPKELEVVA